MLDLSPFTKYETTQYVNERIIAWLDSWFTQQGNVTNPWWKRELVTWLLRNPFVKMARFEQGTPSNLFYIEINCLFDHVSLQARC